MDWHGRHTSCFSSDVNKFRFKPRLNTVIQCYQNTNSDQDDPEVLVQNLSDNELRNWLRQAPDQSVNGAPIRGARIVLSYRSSDSPIQPSEPGAETLTHLPFSRETFTDVMEHLHLSRSFARTVARGGLHVSSNLISKPSYSHTFSCFNMRMDNSWPRDLAMSASANVGTGMTYAIFHGCDHDYFKILTRWIKMMKCSAGHPLLLPALFAELQLRRHKRMTGDNWEKLLELSDRTGQYEKHTPGSAFASSREDDLNYDNTTKEVLGLYQNTGVLETGLIKFQRSIKKMARQSAISIADAPEMRQEFLAEESARLEERLEEMVDDYEGLLAQCKLIIEGSSLLNSAVWNLIAQRENSLNRSIAADSREIASSAKRDSSAMKAIALVTITFLPGTFVSSLFALPLLHWQAPKSNSVVLPRFWMYWAVTIPLTAAVLLIWSTWYLFSSHQRAQHSLAQTKRPGDGLKKRDVLKMNGITALTLHNFWDKLRGNVTNINTAGMTNDMA